MGISLKSIAGLCTLSFIVGFGLGRYSVKEKEIIAKDNVKTNIVQNSVVTANKEIVTTKKTFTHNGKVKSETQTKIYYGLSDSTNTSQIIDSEITKNSLVSVSKKNWMIGGFIPITDYKNYGKYTPQISYRIMGEVWVCFQTDLEITRPMVGMLISF